MSGSFRYSSQGGDPAIRRAGEGIAAMFAPPSTADMANMQRMQLTREEQAARDAAFGQIAALYGPEAAAIARTGQGAHLGEFNRARLSRDAPVDRQIDLSYGDYRASPGGQGADIAGQNARNAATIAGANARNTQDNQRAVAVEAVRPLSADQVRPAAPSVAEMFRVPELAQPQQGNITLRPGEIVHRPDGTRLEGNPQARPQQPPRNYAIVGPDGQVRRTEVSADGVHDMLGQPLIQPGSGERVGSTFNVTGTDTASVTGPTTSNRTDANRLDAELAAGRELIGMIRQTTRDNPGVFGLPGAIRGVAQDVRQTLLETIAAFGDRRPDLARIGQDLQAGLASIAPEYYDRSIPRAQKLLYELAYFNARMNNPSGEVSRTALERNLDMLGSGGLFANNERVEAMLQATEAAMEARSRAVSALRTPGGAPAPGATRPAVSTAPPRPGQPAPAAPAAPPSIPGPGGAGTAEPPPAAGPREGQTATNPQTGARVVFRAGQWVPM